MKRTFIITGGVLGVLIGMGLVMPAFAQWKQEGAMIGRSPALFSLGLLMTIGGITAAIRALRSRCV